MKIVCETSSLLHNIREEEERATLKKLNVRKFRFSVLNCSGMKRRTPPTKASVTARLGHRGCSSLLKLLGGTA
jgi:hypothetical protein